MAVGEDRSVGAPPGARSARGRATGSGWYLAAVAAMVVVAAGAGIAGTGTYGGMPPLLRETWRAQDMVNLLVVAVAVMAWQRARTGSLPSHLVLLGTWFWFAYCYAHLAFAAPFGPVFLLDVAVLALSTYALVDGLVRTDPGAVDRLLARAPRRAAGWFLAVAGAGIAVLWLSDIALGFAGRAPANLHLEVLPNPTWVLDLGWVIPMAVGSGIGLIRGRCWAPLLAVPTLVALTVLSVAMLTLTPVALAVGLDEDPAIAPQLVAFTAVFAALGAVEAWLLVTAARRFSAVPPGWLRASWWPQWAAAGVERAS